MIKHDYKLDYNGERGEKSESNMWMLPNSG